MLLACMPLASTTRWADWRMSEASTPMTSLAPALAAKRERMPVPHPTSSTTLAGEVGGRMGG